MTYSQEFIELLRKQDPKAFESMYTDTADQFFRYCKTYYFLNENEIDDLIGDFYVKVWGILPTVKSHYNFQAFLWTMFKNSCKDYFKKRKEVYGSSDQLQIWSGDPSDDSDVEQLELLEQSYQFDQIKQAMSQLDAVSQELIYLKYIEHKSYTEIAQITNITETNIRQKCSRGLRQLQSLLSQ